MPNATGLGIIELERHVRHVHKKCEPSPIPTVERNLPTRIERFVCIGSLFTMSFISMTVIAWFISSL